MHLMHPSMHSAQAVQFFALVVKDTTRAVLLTAVLRLFTIMLETMINPGVSPSDSIFILLPQVPFIGWTGDMPLAGNSIQRLLQSAAKPFISTFMKRTGQQFFMHDTDGGNTPLLVSPNLPFVCCLVMFR